MSTPGIVGDEIDKQAALAAIVVQEVSGLGAGTSARKLFPRAVVAMLGPYSAAEEHKTVSLDSIG